jgi:hypothetical protein
MQMGSGLTTEYKTKFSHNDVPPSFNKSGGRGHWRSFHGYKRKWQMIFEVKMMGALPRKRYKRVVATAHLRFQTKRTRDEGNYRTILEKSLGDALVNGGWLQDDDTERFVFQHVVIDKETGTSQTTIHLRLEEL